MENNETSKDEAVLEVQVWTNETYGSHLAEHFTYENGYNDALDAFNISKEEFQIPSGTTIYFPVDYDVYAYEVEDTITQYF